MSRVAWHSPGPGCGSWRPALYGSLIQPSKAGSRIPSPQSKKRTFLYGDNHLRTRLNFEGRHLWMISFDREQLVVPLSDSQVPRAREEGSARMGHAIDSLVSGLHYWWPRPVYPRRITKRRIVRRHGCRKRMWYYARVCCGSASHWRLVLRPLLPPLACHERGSDAIMAHTTRASDVPRKSSGALAGKGEQVVTG